MTAPPKVPTLVYRSYLDVKKTQNYTDLIPDRVSVERCAIVARVRVILGGSR